MHTVIRTASALTLAATATAAASSSPAEISLSGSISIPFAGADLFAPRAPAWTIRAPRRAASPTSARARPSTIGGPKG